MAFHIHYICHHALSFSGVPPIHTPLATLEALPADVKSRLYIVHKNPKDVPASSGLKSALVGPQHTIVIERTPPPNSTALEILDLMGSIELFSSFIISRALEMIQCGTYLYFGRGSVLIAEGTYGSTFYIIAMGTVSVSQNGQVLKSMSVGDHFGEMSCLEKQSVKRTATIRAETPVEVIQFTKSEFLHIVRDTNAIERLKQLGAMQRSKSWQVIAANSVLSQMSSSQKTYLQSIMQRRNCQAEEEIWSVGSDASEAILVSSGSFAFARATDIPPFRIGTFIGDTKCLLNQTPNTTSLLCTEAGSIYYVKRDDLVKFFDFNPGVQVRFLNRRFIE